MKVSRQHIFMSPVSSLARNGLIDCLLTCVAVFSLAGCGSQPVPLKVSSSSQVSAVSGRVMGGQQPVAGASVYLFGTLSAGEGYGYDANDQYGFAGSAIPVSTASDGTFSLTSKLQCLDDTQVYLFVAGGNSGSGTNGNLTLMAALGYCDRLNSSSIIEVNELTTVATVYALAPFMLPPNPADTADPNAISVGASTTGQQGMALAFASVNQLVNTTTGTAPGPALPANATVDLAKLNSLADILAACVNSTGGVAGDGSLCGDLFTAATPPGGTAPTDTASALLNIVQNPGNDVGALFNLVQADAVFVPALTAIPNDWTLTATYAPAGLSTPSSVAIDAFGNVWLASKGNGAVVELANSGAVASTTSTQGLHTPVALALDAGGVPWVGDSTTSSLIYVQTSGSITASGGTGGLNLPSGIALDAAGNVWVSDRGANTVTVLNKSGMPVSSGYTGAGINKPLAVALSTH
jgi:hypothetical protein